MPPSIIAILILGLLFVLLAGGMPLGFAMGLSGFLGTLLLIDANAALALLGQTAYETSLTYNLSVIPLFVLMGYIAGEAGLNQSLYRACNAWLGHRRGVTIHELRRETARPQRVGERAPGHQLW